MRLEYVGPKTPGHGSIVQATIKWATTSPTTQQWATQSRHDVILYFSHVFVYTVRHYCTMYQWNVSGQHSVVAGQVALWSDKVQEIVIFIPDSDMVNLVHAIYVWNTSDLFVLDTRGACQYPTAGQTWRRLRRHRRRRKQKHSPGSQKKWTTHLYAYLFIVLKWLNSHMLCNSVSTMHLMEWQCSTCLSKCLLETQLNSPLVQVTVQWHK